MSLLGSNVYANPNTPLWDTGASGGGTFPGNVTIGGNLDVSGYIAGSSVDAGLFTLDVSGSGVANIAPLATSLGDPADGIVFQGQLFRFAQQGTKNANTSFTPSVFGANLDNLTVGGTINCLIGPVPTQLITSTKNVEPVAVSPAAPSQFGVDTTVVGIANAEYDVQVSGNVYLVSGIPDATDTVVVTFTSGTGGGLTSVLYTAATDAAIGNYGVSGSGPLTVGGTACGVLMRARVSPSVSGTTLGASVRAFLGGGSTAVYGANLLLLDVQRVR